jgi:hypothetical protein
MPGLAVLTWLMRWVSDHNLFPKDFVEEALKDAPGGVHTVLKGTTRDDVNLVAIGYCYSHKTILHVVLTENAGNTEPGDPYKMNHRM